MLSLARLGHVRTAVLLSAMLLLCGGCGETKPPPVAASAPVVVVEERVEEVSSEPAAQERAAAAPQSDDQGPALVADEVEAASVLPAARDAEVTDRIAELVGLLAAKATDSHTRLMAID